MTDDWRGYVETWCVTNGLPVEADTPWLMQAPAAKEAKRQRSLGASDRVLSGLLHKAAIEAELIKGS